MRCLLLLLCVAALLPAADTLTIFGHKWTVPNASDWKVEGQGDAQVLRLVTPRGPLPGPRRPIQFALAETQDLSHATIEADMRPLGHSLIIVYAYRDPAHFDYAHLSIDTATKEPHHNGIFHVFGGERVRISPVDGPAAFSSNNAWHHVKFMFEGGSGTVRVSVDGRDVPALHAVDLSLRSGRVGLGSFDETGDFKNVKIE